MRAHPRFVCFDDRWADGGPEFPVHWDELVASDWKKAIELSKGTCVLPFGILEKHGPHVAIGSDPFYARYLSQAAAEREYAVGFPGHPRLWV